MHRHKACWGHTSNAYGERFWSANHDGRCTVASYTPAPSTVDEERSANEEMDIDTDILGHDDGENFTIRLRSFSDTLLRRVPLQKQIMTHTQRIRLENKDIARSNNMSYTFQRVCSFSKERDEGDRYIHNGKSVYELAEAGLFHHSFDTKIPLLICFACGFELSGTDEDPLGPHSKDEDGACPMIMGYRRGVNRQAEAKEEKKPLEQLGPSE